MPGEGDGASYYEDNSQAREREDYGYEEARSFSNLYKRKGVYELTLEEKNELLKAEERTEEDFKTLERLMELEEKRRHNCERYGRDWPNF